MRVAALAYCVLHTTDTAAWHSFGSDVAGFAVVPHEDGLCFKLDERAGRIFVQPAPEERYFATGWELRSEQEFLTALAKVAAKGIVCTRGTAEEIAFRRVFDMGWILDPAGNRHEITYGYVTDFSRLQSPVGVRAFVTGDLGFGHMVLPAPNIAETRAFLEDVLGLGLADVLNHRPLGPDGPTQRIDFLHCDNKRHHSVALFEGEVPAGCVHLMVEVPDIDEVGRAYDRMLAAGAPLLATLGKHTNDHMTSFYIATPGGFALEYGFGGRTIDWSRHTVFESTSVSLWGHDFSVGFDTAPAGEPLSQTEPRR